MQSLPKCNRLEGGNEMSSSSRPLTLGSQLKAARIARGLSREQVAIDADMSDEYLRLIEHEYIENPRLDTANRIASALGCRVLVSVVAVDGESKQSKEMDT